MSLIKRVLVLSLIFGSLLSLALETTTKVRVRIERGQRGLQIDGQSLSVQGHVASYRPVAISKTENLTVTRVLVRGSWLWNINRAGKIEFKATPLLMISGAGIQSAGKSLPSQLLLTANKNRFDVIGVLPLEDYLVGVLASEMPLSWPAESLKAQAIAARSYTLATVQERSKQLFHVESDIQDQVFRHILHGVDHHALVEKAFQAVKDTEGMILITPKSKKVLKAYYHADCGGKTSSAKQVWGIGENQGAVLDETCPSNPKASWSLALSAEALQAKMAQILPRKEVPAGSLLANRLVGLEAFRASPKDRIESIKLKFADGHEARVLADKFRAALGYGNLKSTQFEVSQNETEFRFQGKGFGHGVGLCQWGSRMMALRSRKASEILSHYYPQAETDSLMSLNSLASPRVLKK